LRKFKRHARSQRRPMAHLSRWCWAKLSIAFLPVTLLLLAGCGESPNGNSYGWVSDVSGLHATCGTEGIYVSTGRVDFDGVTWKEPEYDSICNYTSGFEVAPGHLGTSIAARRNGVICSQRSMSYNPYETYAWTRSTACASDGNDNYYATVIHQWWASTHQTYVQVTRNSVTVTA